MADDSDDEPASRRSSGWRALGWFWAIVLVAGAAGAGALQWLGPPERPPSAVAAAAPPAATAAPATPPVAAPAAEQDADFVAPPVPPRAPPGAPIPPPDPGLLEAAPQWPGMQLPRIGTGERLPMLAYSAGYDASDMHPRVGLLLADIGMSAEESENANRSLPAAVSFAISPYAFRPEALLQEIRAAGHELLISIPMEPQNYPLDDPGDQALLTSNSQEVNQRHLDWALSRIQGYVGATGALSDLRGERFAASGEAMNQVLDEIARRGLLYVDARPRAPRPTRAVGRSVDVVIDDPAVRPEIEAKLARLEQIAKERGSALGLAGVPRPVTVDRIAAWAQGLASRGVALTPVSALVHIVPPRGGTTPASAIR